MNGLVTTPELASAQTNQAITYAVLHHSFNVAAGCIDNIAAIDRHRFAVMVVKSGATRAGASMILIGNNV